MLKLFPNFYSKHILTSTRGIKEKQIRWSPKEHPSPPAIPFCYGWLSPRVVFPCGMHPQGQGEPDTHFLLLSKSTSPKGTLKQLHPKFWEFLCRLYPSLMDKDFNPSFDKSRQISSLFAYTWIPVWTHRRHSILSHQLVNSERASLVFSQQGHPREGILCLGTWEGHDTEPRKHLNTHSRYPGLISLQNNVGIQPEGAASKRLLWIYSRI